MMLAVILANRHGVRINRVCAIQLAEKQSYNPSIVTAIEPIFNDAPPAGYPDTFSGEDLPKPTTWLRGWPQGRAA